MKTVFLAVCAASASLWTSGVQSQSATPDQLSPQQLQAVADAQRQQGLSDCMSNSSYDAEALRECQAEVEFQYQNMLEGGAAGGEVPAEGVTSEVVSDVADSFYDDKGPNNKGWNNADVE